jgi:hypothetical protein
MIIRFGRSCISASITFRQDDGYLKQLIYLRFPRDHQRLQKYSYTSETDWYVDCMWQNFSVIKFCLMFYVLCESLAQHLYRNWRETCYSSCIRYNSVFLHSCISCLRTAVLKWWYIKPHMWNIKSHYFICQQLLVSAHRVTYFTHQPHPPAAPTLLIRDVTSQWLISHHYTNSIRALHVSVWYILINYLQNK